MALSARTGLLIGAALVAVLVGSVVLRIATLDRERIRIEVETHLSDALGREVRAGELGFALGWELRIAAADVSIANLPGHEAAHLLEAERVGLSLRLWPLLRGRVECDGIALRGATLRLEGEDPAVPRQQPDWNALEDGPEGEAVRLALREVEAERLEVWVGRGDHARHIVLDELVLKASGPREQGDARLRGEVDGGRFRLEGRLGPAAALTDPALTYGVQLEGIALGAEWEVDASLQEPLALRGLQVASLRVRTRDAEARLSGSVADALAFSGVDLAVQAKVSDDALLDGWLGSRLPALDVLDLDGTLRDADGSLGFEGKVTATARDGGAVLELKGVHGNVDDIADLDARFTLRARDLASLPQLLGAKLDLPALAPVTAEGRINGSDGHLGVYDIALQAGTEPGFQLRATGAVANLADFVGVEIGAEFGAPDATALSDWLGRPLPLSGALQGSLQLSDADGSLGIDRLSVADLKHEGVVDFDLEVVAGDLRGGGDIVIDAEVSSEAGLEPMGKLIGLRLPPVGPAAWKGRVQGSASLLAVDGTLRVGASNIHAKGRWKEDSAGRGHLRLALNGAVVRLADFGVSPQGWAGREGGDGRFGWARGERPLDFDVLRGFDAAVTFDARRLAGRGGLEAEKVHLDVDLRRGLLSLRYEDTLEESPLLLTFAADVTDDTPSLALNLESKRFDVTIPAAQVYEDPRFQGLLDFDVELQARGKTADAIARTLSGRVLMTGRDGTFSHAYARAFFQDLFVRILERGSERPPQRYRCLKGDLEIERGVVNARELWVNLHGMHLVGTGSLDLARDRWNLVVRPHVYGAGLIGGGATVEVAGSLTKPTFRARPLSIPVSVGETLASRLLTPLEIAIRPFTGDIDPCLELD